MDDEQEPSHPPSKTNSNVTGDDQLEAALDDCEKSVGRPVMGMEFSSMEEARSYYEAYAGEQGFWIKQRSSKKGRNRIDAITSVQYTCAREGTHREGTGVKNIRTTSTIQNECMAQMRVTVDKYLDKWKVTSFNDVHNHKFVTPTKRHMMRSNRNMPTAVKKLTEAFDREHLRVSKLPAIFHGNTIGFDKRDCYNHLEKVREKHLEIGDAQSVLLYFKKKQVENPFFYYAVQCDEEGTATNFFWVDGRSRVAYRTYGDVVTFDTTYRTNKYNMPFAPFSGVNHHNQSILFGCALLQDETETSFMWLFETWLEAMGGQQPISIITDQDLAMKGAIAKVLSRTRHRLCIWHIKKKFVEKLSHIYFKKSDFKKKMKRCIHWTWTKTEFEDQWGRLMIEFDLVGNEWLRHLYQIRESWVPVYNRDIFFAGMSTTGRSEGMNSFFDDFLTSRTNLREFVVRFDEALKRIVNNETYEDFHSEHKDRIVDQKEFLLVHAAEVYTRRMFKKFKDQWEEIWKFMIEEEWQDEDWRYFSVKTRETVDEYPTQFVVKLDHRKGGGICGCKWFQFSGIICKHIMKVLHRLDLERIPESFIIERWRKGTNRFRMMDATPQLVGMTDDNENAEVLRLNHMCQESMKLACIAAPHKEMYLAYMENVKLLTNKLQSMMLNIRASMIEDVGATSGAASCGYDVASSQAQSEAGFNPSERVILDPNVSQTKGRKKEAARGNEVASSCSRIKSAIEMATQGRKRLCRSCKKLVNHDKRNCPLNPNSKRRKQLMISEVADDDGEEEDIDCRDDDDD